MSKIIEKVRQREAKIAVLHARERFAGMMAEINGEPPLTMSRAVTMKHKTAELEGALLDAAVTLALGVKANLRDGRAGCYLIPCDTGPSESRDGDIFEPSTRWDHGGPIIEHGRIDLEHDAQVQEWRAVHPKHYDGPPYASAVGETALIAAMRAFVTSKLGDEVELP